MRLQPPSLGVTVRDGSTQEMPGEENWGKGSAGLMEFFFAYGVTELLEKWLKLDLLYSLEALECH